MLEAGPRFDRVDAVDAFFKAAIKVPECAYPNTPEAPHPVSNDPDGWYRQSGPDRFKSTYIKGVGGTTWHWLGTCLRLIPSDFRIRSAFGVQSDWPIAYSDLEPFYGQAEREIGVSGDSQETLGAPRSSAYPMGPIPQTFLDKTFARALEGSGYHVRATPQGRNSMERDDRPSCCGSASCIPVCPVQAKYDASIHVDRAEKAGASIAERTNAVSIALNPDRSVAFIGF